MVFNVTFNNISDTCHMYIVAFSFIGGGNQSTLRKPLTCCKPQTNFISYCCIQYTRHVAMAWFKKISQSIISKCDLTKSVLQILYWTLELFWQCGIVFYFVIHHEEMNLMSNGLLQLVSDFLRIVPKKNAQKGKSWNMVEKCYSITPMTHKP